VKCRQMCGKEMCAVFEFMDGVEESYTNIDCLT
jgi:hypothetical protein